MTHPDPTIAPLADLQWLRRFARVLARDADEADDLVQEALVATWRRGPDREGSLRPWLATVVRNLFRMRLRADARRERREHTADLPTFAPEPDRELERLAVLKILLGEIEALPADDQRILVRRFFAGEQAVDIGRELGIPPATIRSRLNRSLKRLRVRLDERCHGRKTWSAAVLILPPAATTTTTLPASATTKGGTMSILAKPLLIIATAAAAGVAAFLALGGDRHESSQMTEETSSTPPTATPAQPPPDPRRAAWEERKREIRRRLPPLPNSTPSDPLAVNDALRASFTACMEDLGVKANGALTIDVTEIGAPDIGTIYESVDIVETTFPDKEVLTCLTESMLGWVGDPPDESFERRPRITMVLGEPADDAEKERRQFEAIVGAHVREIQFCERKAPDPRGRLTLLFVMGEPQDRTLRAKSVTPTLSEVPQPVVDCAVERGLAWAFPTKMAGKSYEYTFTMPIGATKSAP